MEFWTLITKHFSYVCVLCIDVFVRWGAVGSLLNNSLMDSSHVLLTQAQWNNWKMTVASEFTPVSKKSELHSEYFVNLIPTARNKGLHLAWITFIVSLLHLCILSVDFDRAFASLNEEWMKSCDIRGLVLEMMLSQTILNLLRRLWGSSSASWLGMLKGVMCSGESVLLSKRNLLLKKWKWNLWDHIDALNY